MSIFTEIAKNYNIADREFVLRLSGADVLCLVSMIQLAAATADPPAKFHILFPEAGPIAEGIIQVIREVDGAAADQLLSGWRLEKK